MRNRKYRKKKERRRKRRRKKRGKNNYKNNWKKRNNKWIWGNKWYTKISKIWRRDWVFIKKKEESSRISIMVSKRRT